MKEMIVLLANVMDLKRTELLQTVSAVMENCESHG